MMQTSPAGRAMIERFEGLVLKAMRPMHGTDVWTIGYGHTGPDVYEGLVWTKEQADEALSHRLANEFEPGVLHAIKSPPTPVTQGQFDAMVSLAYNIGVRGFAGSEVARHHMAGEYQEASDAFDNWANYHGQHNDALAHRRDVEGQMYLDASP